MDLVIENLTKTFKDIVAVDYFSAELSKGVYGLLGPNGAGKTTLLRMLADILEPTSGRILLDGKDIALLGDEYREVIGYLPQEFGLYKNFSAERFLMYFASLKGLDKELSIKRLDEVLELTNLKEFKKKKIGNFSGGMKRRLGIAQALLNDPDILIVDEPTAGLDPQERVRFRNLLSQIGDDKTVILSTHIVSDIQFIAKKIFLMGDGQLIKSGSLEELLGEIKDKVWEANVSQEELQSIQGKYKVGNLHRGELGIKVRIVSDDQPISQANSISPTLEDVYLYYFDQEVNESV